MSHKNHWMECCRNCGLAPTKTEAGGERCLWLPKSRRELRAPCILRLQPSAAKLYWARKRNFAFYLPGLKSAERWPILSWDWQRKQNSAISYFRQQIKVQIKRNCFCQFWKLELKNLILYKILCCIKPLEKLNK